MIIKEVERYEAEVLGVVENASKDGRPSSWAIKCSEEGLGDKVTIKTEDKPVAQKGMKVLVIIGYD